MRVPKGVMKVAKICALDVDAAHYRSAVRVQRTGVDRLRVEVCDGRAAVRVDCAEPASDILPGFGVDDEPVDDFEQLIPAQAALDADGAISKSGSYFIVDEAPPEGSIRLIAPEAVQQMWDGRPVEAAWPTIDDALPDYQLVSMPAPRSGKPIPAVRVAFDTKLLASLVNAINAVAGSHAFVLDVPLVQGKVVRVHPHEGNGEAKISACIMPIASEGKRRSIDVDVLRGFEETQLHLPFVPGVPIEAAPPATDERGDAPTAGSADAEQAAFNAATIGEIGVTGALLEKLEADGIRTGKELAAWLQDRFHKKIAGIGDEKRSALNELCAQWYERRRSAAATVHASKPPESEEKSETTDAEQDLYMLPLDRVDVTGADVSHLFKDGKKKRKAVKADPITFEKQQWVAVFIDVTTRWMAKLLPLYPVKEFERDFLDIPTKFAPDEKGYPGTVVRVGNREFAIGPKEEVRTLVDLLTPADLGIAGGAIGIACCPHILTVTDGKAAHVQTVLEYAGKKWIATPAPAGISDADVYAVRPLYAVGKAPAPGQNDAYCGRLVTYDVGGRKREMEIGPVGEALIVREG